MEAWMSLTAVLVEASSGLAYTALRKKVLVTTGSLGNAGISSHTGSSLLDP
jgi:hypothetical protein